MIRPSIKFRLPFMLFRSRLLPPVFSALLCLAGAGGVLGQASSAPAPVPPAPAPGAAPVLPAGPLLSPLAIRPDWAALVQYAGAMTREEFEQAFDSIYSDMAADPRPWRTSPEALVVETGPGLPAVTIPLRQAGAEPARPVRYWRTVKELAPLAPGEPPLKGLHIALDPGHIGGAYAQMEERWLSMRPNEAIMEGHLVLEVARVLKPRLEALGAVVTYVRGEEAPVTTQRPESLYPEALRVLQEAGIARPRESYAGLVDDARIPTVQWQAEKLFYRVSEIRARAQRVNVELKPDLVLCLHLNAEAWGDPKKPAFVGANHFHLLVNGCYSTDELRHEDVRYEMLLRLLTRVHEEELPMADVLAETVAEATGLPPYTYLKTTARRVSGSPYVWARNLLANRLYQCPVLYFEPYVMNHELTYRRLLLGHYVGRTLLDGELVTSPLEDYARGIVRGLEVYYTKNRRQGGG